MPAQAKPQQFLADGAYRFKFDLPAGWRKTTDKRGGLLLVPPYGHALIYLVMVSGDKWRGRSDSAVVQAVSQVAGVVMNDKQEPERITAADGARIIHGTAYYGTMPAEHGLARRARIVLFKLSPDTWAQVWTVTQPGMNAKESAALSNVLNSISLSSR
ncbi:MAG: hypothetical protein P8Y53_01230 [Pseudolabrys sp.]